MAPVVPRATHFPPFEPKTEYEREYFAVPKPYRKQSLFWSCFLSPALTALGLHKESDPSFGRLSLPFSPAEKALREDATISVEDYFIWDPNLKTDEPGSSDSAAVQPPFHSSKGAAWIAYQVWQNKAAAQAHHNKTDLYWCHGINDYAGSFANHAQPYLDAGYRVIIPDLPSHGRSSGLHVHIASADELSRTLHLVMKEVIRNDKLNGRKQKQTFIAGASMGGWTIASYCLRYTTGGSETLKDNPPVAGAILQCPLLGVQPDSRPSHAVETLARALASFAGRWPLAEANKGKNTEDPAIETRIERDPMTYNDKLRISTGLALLQGLAGVTPHFADFTLPIFLIHGTADRVTDWKLTKQLFEQASSKDKQLLLLEDFEHILLRKGRDEEDDRRRQVVLKATLDWLEERREK